MTVVVTSGTQFFGGTAFEAFSWDTLILADETWPGIASVTGQAVNRKIDVKRTKGSDGATIKDEGNDPAEFEIELLLYTPDQLAELERLLPLIQPRRKGGARAPVSILYPSLRMLGIDKVYIKSIKIPALDKTEQLLRINIGVIEYFPAPKPIKKGAGTSGGKGTDKKDPVDKDKEGKDKDEQDWTTGKKGSGGLHDKFANAEGDQAKADQSNTYPEGE